MRAVIGLAAALLTVGPASPAFAAEPDQQQGVPTAQAQEASSSQPAPSSSQLQTGVKPPAVETAAPVAASSVTTSAAAKPELAKNEKNLIRMGYKLEVRDGENWFCKREPVLGSRLQQAKTCGTAAMIDKQHQNNQESMQSALKGANMPAHMGNP